MKIGLTVKTIIDFPTFSYFVVDLVLDHSGMKNNHILMSENKDASIFVIKKQQLKYSRMHLELVLCFYYLI